MGAPPSKMPDRIARIELVGAGLSDNSHRGAGQWFIDLKRLNIRLHVVHPPAHIWVDAGEGVLNEDLAIGKLWQLYLLETEVPCGRRPIRARGENPLFSCGHHAAP